MSNESLPIAAALGEAMRAYQDAVDDFDREVARLLGVNETDLRCLGVLLQNEAGAAPSELAAALGLTSGAATAMLDRLERAGFVVRSPHPTDRRKTVVRATPAAAKRALPFYEALVDEAGRDLVSRYSVPQLEVLVDFLQRARELQERHVEQLRGMP